MYPESVALANDNVRQVTVPTMPGNFRQFDAGLTAMIVKETQLNLLGKLRKKGKVSASSVICCAVRISSTGSYFHEKSPSVLRRAAKRTTLTLPHMMVHRNMASLASMVGWQGVVFG